MSPPRTDSSICPARPRVSGASVRIFRYLVLIGLLQTQLYSVCSADLSALDRIPCPTPLAVGFADGEDVICGMLTVPQRHAAPDANGSLQLAVAVLPALGTASPEPLVLLAGGPGESTFDAYLPGLANPLARPFRERYDIVLIEMRGLKYARPNLTSPELADHRWRWLSERGAYDSTAVQDQMLAVQAFLDRLLDQGIDPAVFNHQEMAADVILVLDALGYEKANLYGNSAGTILVQELLRRYPNRVRAAVMGSVIPPSINPRATNPAVAEQALRRLFEQVRNDARAAVAFPDLESQFEQTVNRLNRRPEVVAITDPIRGQPVKVVITGDRLTEIVYVMMLLDPLGPRSIPIFLQSLAEEDYGLLTNFGQLLFPAPDFSWGVQLSVSLAKFAPADEADTAGLYPHVERVLRYWKFGQVPLEAARNVWPHATLFDGSRDLVRTDVPVLLLSGDLDPATPPQFAETIAEAIPQSVLCTFAGIAHGPLDSGACAYSIVDDFLTNPDEQPDRSCIAAVRPRFITEPLARRLLLSEPPYVRLTLLLGSSLWVVIAAAIFSTWVYRAGNDARPSKARFADWTCWVAVVLNVVFVAAVVATLVSSGDAMGVLYGFPPLMQAARILPFVAIIPGILSVGFVWIGWRHGLWGATRRVYMLSVLVSLVVFFWQLSWWHLI